MSAQHGIMRNSTLGIVSGLSLSVAGFACSVLVARMLGVGASGSVAMALWIVSAAVMVHEIGLGGTLARFLPVTRDDPQARQNILGTLLRTSIVAISVGLAVVATCLWFYWPVVLESHAESPAQAAVFCGLILLCFVCHMLQGFAYHYMRGTDQFRGIAMRSLVGAAAQIGVVVAGGLLFGVNGALAGYIIGSVPMALIVLRLRPRGRVDRETRGRLMRYSWTLWVAVLLSPIVWTRLDLLLVERLLDIHSVGLFAVAATLSALLIQLCMMVCSAVVPHLAAADPAHRLEASRTVIKCVLALLLPATLGAAAIAPALLPMIYGPDFAPAGTTARLLAVAAVGSVVTMTLSNILNLLERNGTLILGGAVGAVATIGFGLLLIPVHGILGAALARLIAQTMVAGITIGQLNRLQPGTVQGGWFSALLLSALLSASSAAGVLALWPGGAGMGLAILTGGVVHAVVARLIVPLTAAEDAWLRGFLQRRAPALRIPRFGRGGA